MPSTGCCHQSFRFRNIGFAKEKLAIKIGQVNGVEVNLVMSVSLVITEKKIVAKRSIACGRIKGLTISMFAKPTRTRFFTEGMASAAVGELIQAKTEVSLVVEVLGGKGEARNSSQSSHPIPPAPTTSTGVSLTLWYRSGPSSA